jgi:endo-1,4-beta-xylanase
MKAPVNSKAIKAFSFIMPVVFIFSASFSKGPKTLKDSFQNVFYIGTALSGKQVLGKEPNILPLVESQFNSIVAENVMKCALIHPKQNEYNFEQADSFVAYGVKHKMFIIGHTLLWHNQTPRWIFEDVSGKPANRDTLLKRLHDHIFTVVTRYKGRVNGWDVVNEALNEDGSLRKTKWFEIIGEDYIQKAFEFAREADPKAQLYYNDYNIELPAKRAGTIKLIKNLQAKGVKVDGIGIQAHWHLDVPSLADVDSGIREFSSLGVKVMMTEMDINVLPRPENLQGANITDQFALTKESNPFPDAFPDSMQQILAKRYADLFKIFVKYKKNVSRVTFWGVYDGESWLNNWPIRGRTNYPLLFDRKLQPKPAFYSVIETAKEIK